MKNVIYYFSGTGNSLYIAKKIQETLGDTDCIHITSALRDSHPSIDADVLGFVFPVYAFGPPVLVEAFLKQATIRQPEYSFVVATHGGGPGNTLKYFERLLRKKGIALQSAFDIKMPNNYVTGSNPSSEEQLNKILVDNAPKLSAILTTITQKEHRAIPRSAIYSKILTPIVHPLFAMAVKRQDKKFYTSETCTGCGICEKLCPTGNIRLNDDKRPEWRQQCELCQACINWCPQKAIQFGKSTEARERYHHPDITLSELFCNSPQ